MQRARMFGVLMGLAWIVTGCGVGQVDGGGGDGTGYDRDIPADDGRAHGDAGPGECIPPEVTNLVTTYCAKCHGDKPFGNKLSLTKPGAFEALLPNKGNQTVKAVALARLQNGTMPPGPKKPTAAEVATFAAWVNGSLVADCGGGPDAGTADSGDGSTVDAGAPVDAGNPTADAGGSDDDVFATDPEGICTSGVGSSARRGTTMQPGEACLTCHSKSPRLPQFTIAGTLYPTGHEVRGCVGHGAMDAVIRVTDAQGKKVVDLVPNEVGTFVSLDAMPAGFHVKVVSSKGERAMLNSPPNGNCNSCHTPDGANGAPGRIRLP